MLVTGSGQTPEVIATEPGAMWIFFLLGLLPFLPFGWGFTFLVFAIPIWLIYWQVKFGSLQTSDADYKRAKRDRKQGLRRLHA